MQERVSQLRKAKGFNDDEGEVPSRFSGKNGQRHKSKWDALDDVEVDGAEEEESEESEESDEEGTGKFTEPEGGELFVCKAHFKAALSETYPSVSQAQAARYQQLRAQFERGEIDSDLSLDPYAASSKAASTAMRVSHM